MKILSKNIPIKYLYIISVAVILLISGLLYVTYAMFTANVSAGSVISLDTTLYYEFDVSGNQEFSIAGNSTTSFYVTVNNKTEGSIYYEVYYYTENDLTNVTIAEVVEDKSVTPIAPTTGGVLNKNTNIDIPIVIENKSNATLNITVGVVTGYVGNEVEYGTGIYPKGTKITSTYNKSDVIASCNSSDLEVSDVCEEKIVNGHLIKTCVVSDIELSPYQDESKANAPELADGMILWYIWIQLKSG